MLEAEARWVGNTLDNLPADNLSPLLNIGSATAEFREQVQPWIDQSIFAPLRARAVEVQHLDMREGAGIDLHGDLTDDRFMTGLADHKFRALMCCNLLEHVADPAAICEKIEGLMPVGAYLIVTVPNRFPYHPDPIDTMFRPDVSTLARLFPRCRLIDGKIIDCGTGWDYVDRNPIALFAKVRRRFAGLSENGGVKGSTSFASWLFRQFRQSCALLQRQQ